MKAYVEDDHFIVDGLPYEDRELAREWGFYWSKPRQVWTCPANYISAFALLSDANVEDDVDGIRSYIKPRGHRFFDPRRDIKKQPIFRGLKDTTVPMLHQCDGACRVIHKKRFGLFFEMATGKTLTSLMAADELFARGLIERVLVVCPISLFSTWKDEADKHLKEKVNFHILWAETTRKKKAAEKRKEAVHEFMSAKGRVFGITSWDTLPRIEDDYFEALGYDPDKDEHELPIFVIGDESSFIKNRTAGRTESAIRIADASSYVTALTGTPYVSNAADLWSQMRFLSQKYAGQSYWRYAHRYILFDNSPWQRPIGIRRENSKELKSLISVFSMSVSKEEVLNLPKKMHQVRVLAAASEQKRVLRKMMEEFEFTVQAIKKGKKSKKEERILIRNALSRVNKLQQVTMGWTKNKAKEVIYFKQNPKVDALFEILEEASGHRVVVFSRYVEDLKLLSVKLTKAKISHVEYHGRIPAKKADKNLQKFKSRKVTAFLCQVQKGGFGLDLTASDVCIYVSNWWSAGVRRQSEDRLHRPGQENRPLYIDLMVEDSMDRAIKDAIKRNQSLAQYLFGKKKGAGINNEEFDHE
jgi:SNF2 family DNA or RNA helicase